MPAHYHFLFGNNTDATVNPGGQTPTNSKSVCQAIVGLQGGGTTTAQIFSSGPPNGAMALGLSNYGGSQPHENRQGFGVVNFCVALQGTFPSRN